MAKRDAFGQLAHDKQGKCERCELRYTWRGKPLLRQALCPKCKHPLARTSHEMKRFRHIYDVHPLMTIEE